MNGPSIYKPAGPFFILMTKMIVSLFKGKMAPVPLAGQ
jgi:hypothetical protein